MATFRSRGSLRKVELCIVVIVLGVILSISVPDLVRARRESRLEKTIANLSRIQIAKSRFAKYNHLIEGSIVNDAVDLVPKYMPTWPDGPIDNSVYTAQAVGTEPTMNGQNAESLRAVCSGAVSFSSCPF